MLRAGFVQAMRRHGGVQIEQMEEYGVKRVIRDIRIDDLLGSEISVARTS
jgi:hypothetical protein